MFESVFRVKYVSLKTCFIYLCPTHHNLNTGINLKLVYGDNKTAYFSASIVKNTVYPECIGINSAYAKVLGIKENDFVNVSQVAQLPIVNSIAIKPTSHHDYQVLEILAQNVQSNLLDQVMVVNAGQSLVIWIGNSILVTVLIDYIHPISPGVLDFLTEVVIKPPDENKTANANTLMNEQQPEQYIENFLKFIKKNSSQVLPLNGVELNHINQELYYRIISIAEFPNIKNIQQNIHPFTAFVSKNGPYKDFYETCSNNSAFYTMTLLNSPYFVKKIHIKLSFIEEVSDLRSEKNNNILFNIFVSDVVFNYMQCEFASRVVLKKVEKIPYVNEIEVHSKKNYSTNVIQKLKIYLADNSNEPMILNPDIPMEIDKNVYYSLKFLPQSSDFCIVDDDLIRNCSYTLCHEEILPLEPTLKLEENPNKLCINISLVKGVFYKILTVLCKNKIYDAENILITGKPGSGKSSVLNYISTTFKRYPYFVNSEIIQCKKIKGKTVDTLHKLFSDVFVKLVLCQPSLLILDDLHVLCERCEGEETPNTMYFNRTSEMIFSLFSIVARFNCIGILASTESVLKLNKNVYRSRGNHLFKNIFTIHDLNKADRITLIKHFLKRNLVANVDYNELSTKTDGFVIQDIEDFCNKTLFEAYKDETYKDKEPTITQNHFDKALEKSCALSLQNVKFHSLGSKSFDDIGGLHDIKSILIESLMLPVKYPTIFANAPLRLQSGLLLYGPPGTGKTLLAGAAAKQCSLRLISIKGPELLSKYIGASEQSVRDVFEKAQSAKPCILFFDEFDSLAPRRGHDNTGVTDRVVNQLLTQLDGVESLTGVCVLAATSRPDLLDPALLRPGRLDKQLLCPMPNQDDRLDILQILSHNLEFSEDVRLNEIALQTEGYSGADLQSVLYTAQISSVSEIHENETTKLVTSKITQTGLLEALEKTRPSLTKSERKKYDMIYAKFRGGYSEDFRAGSKVTLA